MLSKPAPQRAGAPHVLGCTCRCELCQPAGRGPRPVRGQGSSASPRAHSGTGHWHSAHRSAKRVKPPKVAFGLMCHKSVWGLQRARIRTSRTIPSRAGRPPSAARGGRSIQMLMCLSGLSASVKGGWAVDGQPLSPPPRDDSRNSWFSSQRHRLETSYKIALSGHVGRLPKDKHLIAPGEGPPPPPHPAPHSPV